MAKILSKNINIYPTGFRGLNDQQVAFDPESIYNTEDNLTRPYRFITNGSYVVSKEYEEDSEFVFILGGYYFDIRKFIIPDDLKDKSEVFAHIKIESKGTTTDDSNTSYKANSLRPLDVSNVDDLDSKSNNVYYFDGLVLDENQHNSEKYTYTLKILEKVNGSWKIPGESKLKFSTNDIEGGTDYNTGKNVGLNNQLDTKLIYNPNGCLTVQGKDQVEIKSVDSYHDAGVKTIWNSSTNSIFSQGDSIESSVIGEREFASIYLDNDGISLTKDFNNGEKFLSVDITDSEIGLKTHDTDGACDGNIIISNNEASSINMEVNNNGDTSELNLDDTGVEISASKNKHILFKNYVDNNISSDINMMENGKIDISTNKSGASIDLVTKDSNSNINLTASKSNIVLKTIGSGNSIKSTTSSSGTIINSIGESNYTKSITTLDESGFEVYADKEIKLNVVVESSPNGLILAASGKNLRLFPSIASGNVCSLGHSSAPFTNATITNVSASSVVSKAIIVNGSSANGSIRVNVGSSSSTNYGLVVANDANATYSTKISPVCVVTQSYYAASDRRLKENIKPFNYSKPITDIEVKEFNFKGDKNKTIGIIAQDLQEIYPQLVHENENGYLSIQEDKLVYLLLEEVKQLKKEVNELKNIKK